MNFKKILPLFLLAITIAVVIMIPALSTKIHSIGFSGKATNKLAPNFHLKDLNDKVFTHQDLKGKWTLLTFGFSKCNGICPLNMAKLSSIIDYFDERQPSSIEETQFFFISIDPIRDSKESMKSFSSNFSKKIKPLISGKDNGIKVSTKYKSYLRWNEEKVRNEDDYQIQHAGIFYLIDPHGIIKMIYLDNEVKAEEIIKDYQTLRT